MMLRLQQLTPGLGNWASMNAPLRGVDVGFHYEYKMSNCFLPGLRLSSDLSARYMVCKYKLIPEGLESVHCGQDGCNAPLRS